MKKKLLALLMFCLLICSMSTAVFGAEKEERKESEREKRR